MGVQYLGEGCLSWTDVGVKGVRDAKNRRCDAKSVSCEVSVCEMVSSFRLQDVVVASMDGVPTRHVILYDESLSGSGRSVLLRLYLLWFQ